MYSNAFTAKQLKSVCSCQDDLDAVKAMVELERRIMNNNYPSYALSNASRNASSNALSNASRNALSNTSHITYSNNNGLYYNISNSTPTSGKLTYVEIPP